MSTGDDATSIPGTPDGPQGPAKERENEEANHRDVSAKGIIKLAEEMQVTLFHTPGRDSFVSFCVKGHWENRPVKSTAFKEWLSALCYYRKDSVPTQTALSEATNTLAGHALYGSPEKEVYVRVAERDGTIFVDLGNDSWEAVKITTQGWEIVPHVPVKFVRAPGMLALPHPTRGGSVEDLRQFVNVDDEDHWKLVVSWLVAALRPTGPFPLLVLEGVHGSAKSTCSRVLISLVDPKTAPIRGAPRNPHDLAISAENSWCLAYDNLSEVKPWLSDALCRLSTGSGFSTRTLYTDGDEKIFEGMRPVLLNGIDIGIERPDLLDRSMILSLAPISEDRRETEAQLWAHFESVRPGILGCLLDAVACALRRLPEVDLPRKPRMADFAEWVSAAEPALGWPEGAFLEAYRRNQQDSNNLALEASALAQAIQCLADRGPWEGTATDLAGELTNIQLTVTPAESVKPVPKDPRELSQELRRITPNLANAGITVDFGRTPGDNSRRTITVRRACDGATQNAPEESRQE